MTILFDATKPRKSDRTRLFGLGLGRTRPARPHHGPSDADREWLAANTSRPSTAPTEAEYRAFVESRSMSLAEFNARLEEQAREAYEMDALCRGFIFG